MRALGRPQEHVHELRHSAATWFFSSVEFGTGNAAARRHHRRLTASRAVSAEGVHTEPVVCCGWQGGRRPIPWERPTSWSHHIHAFTIQRPSCWDLALKGVLYRPQLQAHPAIKRKPGLSLSPVTAPAVAVPARFQLGTDVFLVCFWMYNYHLDAVDFPTFVGKWQRAMSGERVKSRRHWFSTSPTATSLKAPSPSMIGCRDFLWPRPLR